jgi:hypothetical protein
MVRFWRKHDCAGRSVRMVLFYLRYMGLILGLQIHTPYLGQTITRRMDFLTGAIDSYQLAGMDMLRSWLCYMGLILG